MNSQGEVSGPRARGRVRFRYLESYWGSVLVRLGSGSLSKFKATVQFSRRITLRQG